MTDRDLYDRAKARIESSDRLRPYADWLLLWFEIETDGNCYWVLESSEDDLEYWGEGCKLASEGLSSGG